MPDETQFGHEAIAETVRIVDGYIEIFGGATGHSEDSPYDWEIGRLESGSGLATFLRQISQKSWAHPLLLKEIIVTIADWFDGAIERAMREDQMNRRREEAEAQSSSAKPPSPPSPEKSD